LRDPFLLSLPRPFAALPIDSDSISDPKQVGPLVFNRGNGFDPLRQLDEPILKEIPHVRLTGRESTKESGRTGGVLIVNSFQFVSLHSNSGSSE
jgi:hypothetical protein